MANPISRQTGDRRESGFQLTGEVDRDGGTVLPQERLPETVRLPETRLLDRERLLSAQDSREVGDLEASIQAHNQQLLERVGSLFELPLVVLTEQRDHALRRLARTEERAAEQRRRLVAEQDKFIGLLMADHEAKLRELRSDCERLQYELAASRTVVGANGTDVTMPPPEALAPDLSSLRQELETAQAEIDETRADALRLQEERDEAIRATDDVRVELMGELESARDEAFQLETRLDETQRLLEDARDQARDEVLRLTEELAELRAQLDSQNDEVRRLRARLVAHTAGPATRPGTGPERVPTRTVRLTPSGHEQR